MKLQLAKNLRLSEATASYIKFAERFARMRLRRWGYKNPWSVTMKLGLSDCGRGYSGRAWGRRGTGVAKVKLANRIEPHVHVYPRFQNMPTFTLWNRAEAVVYIVAHELGHIIAPWRNKDGERACCLFGYEAVQAFRDRQYDHPACLI